METKYPITFRNAQEAFKNAIKRGVLSESKHAANFAGLYMYMGTLNGADQFKHKLTRKYISVEA